MIPLRRVDRLDYATAIAVVRIPTGAIVDARMTAPIVTRRGGEVAFLMLDDATFVLALSPQLHAWPNPHNAETLHRVMLYAATPERLAIIEVRRMLDPRRRDALYKADLRATTSVA